MHQTFNTPEDFYRNAMEGIHKILHTKLEMLGVSPEELPYLVEEGILERVAAETDDDKVLEVYSYKGIKLIEVIWTTNGIKQVDIHKDEREFNRNI